MIRLAIMALVFFFIPVYAQENIKVGLYNNAPKIFLNEDQKPAGFYVDLLDAIAKAEHWTLEYIPCIWEECLEKLHNNEIDILPDFAYSNERNTYLDFENEVVLSSWSVIYTHKDETILSILDLNDKTIAVLKNSIQLYDIKEQSKLFDIQPNFMEVEKIPETLTLLNTHKVDAAIVNNFYNFSPKMLPNIKKTNIFLNPFMLNFGIAHKEDNSLKDTLDNYLKIYKADKTSPYYQAKKRWLAQEESTPLPSWALWVMSLGLVGLLVLATTVLLFKYLLHKKVKELKANEKILLAQSRSAAMGEMISMIAHQWKQPLSILSMIANNLKADVELGTLDAKMVQEYHNQLSSQIFYLSHTIDDFRNFFKLNKEKQLIPNLDQVVENALNLMGKSLENNHIHLVKEYQPIKNILIYANELVQVLLNLIKNSNEAFAHNNAHSNKHLIIRIYRQKDNAIIEVEDNAGGIKAEIREKIFDPYFTTKEEFNGTGLGLYMSKTIIENHFAGTIILTCKDETSLFTITFPITEEEA